MGIASPPKMEIAMTGENSQTSRQDHDPVSGSGFNYFAPLATRVLGPSEFRFHHYTITTPHQTMPLSNRRSRRVSSPDRRVVTPPRPSG